MNLDEIKSVPIPRKRRMRVGRGPGSGKGKTAGRGTKGQQSRSGYSRKIGHEGGQMPLFRRLPKRGFTNAKFKTEVTILNLAALQQFEAGETVDLAKLKARGLVSRDASFLKILGNGTIDRALTVCADRFSASAKAAIEAAGGKAEEIG